jgi:DNA-binding transcriptional LysR family regulator
LFHEQRHLVVSPNHPHFAELRKASSRHMRQCTLITSFLDTPELRPSQRRIRDRFHAVWEISSLSLRMHLVEQGLGVAFIDGKLLREHPLCRDFAMLDGLPFSTIERQVGLYYRQGHQVSVAQQRFIEACGEFWKV